VPIKFNFNICDNSPECSGRAVCPTGAIFWDEIGINAFGEKGVLCVEDNKCISCGQCVGDDGCPVGAIVFAHTKEELAELIKGTEIDINKVKDLFVERYGAEPIDGGICIKPDEIESKLWEGITVIEDFDECSIQCLLMAIPIDLIISRIKVLAGSSDVRFFKCDCTGNKNNENELPTLKIYNNYQLIGHIDGYYDNSQINELIEAIQKLKI
jgi:Fe-S-cluster-containing hydrogenase component 2